MKNYMNVDYGEINDTETAARESGYRQLTGTEIKVQVVDSVFLGSYLRGFKYIIAINADGTLEGKNNYGHYDLGAWLIDTKKNTMSVNWNYGWDSATTRLYEVDGAIKMYDINTGRWRTTLNQSIDKPQDIKTYQL